MTDCAVYSHQASRWLEIRGNSNTVQRCRFSNKTGSGAAVAKEQMAVIWVGEGFGKDNKAMEGPSLHNIKKMIFVLFCWAV